MISFAVAIALLLHVFLWGVGLAMLVMPRPWARFWPIAVFPAGFALQSVVVWLGAYANLRGTNAYAWPAELVPLALLVFATYRRGPARVRADLGRFGLLWVVTGGALVLLVLPVALASRGLTSLSLGSCDAADYAAGARVLREFARHDRTGFLGLTEVVRVMSTDNFFDFWLRLNHFTPSALIALNGTILDCAPHELATLLTMVVLAGTVPVVFWVARALFGYSGVASLTIAAVYGISPIPWYSVAHVSPAPLLAALAIALLTWAGVALFELRLTSHRAVQFAGILAVAYALLLGSYNFILLVCLVPVIAYAGTRTLLTGAWTRVGPWLAALLLPLAGMGLVFWDRVAGLVERFRLFQTYDFGWRIPLLTPEGWLGMVAGGSLLAWSWAGLRWLLAAIVAAALGWAVTRTLRNDRRRGWLVVSVTVPILIGYGFLEIRGMLHGTNASYDAFKLLTVFYPVLLAAFCWWITLRWSSRLGEWFGVVALAAVVVGFNLLGCATGVYQLSRAPLIVDGELRQLRRVEAMPDVTSVNLLIPDMWSRLWANAFLLRKPQYFLTHTYEGRLNTALRGEWDLVGEVVRVRPPGAASREVTRHYWLADTRDAAFLRATPGEHWHPEERIRNGERWCWTSADATVRIDNPHPYPVTVRVRMDGRSFGERDVSVGLVGGASTEPVHVGEARQWYDFPAVTIRPGTSTLVLHSKQRAGGTRGDTRPLALCVFALELQTSISP